MIRHVLEVWLLLLVAFVVGCGLGSLLYVLLAHGPMARPQEALADGVGHAVDEVRRRLGLAPLGRPVRHPPTPRERYYDDRYPDYGEPRQRDEDAFAGHREPQYDEEVQPAAMAPGALDHVYDDDVENVDREPPESREAWDGEPAWQGGDAEAGEIAHDGIAAEATAMVAAPTEKPGPGPELPMMRPAGLAGPRNGVPDDLQRIRGVGKKNEELLNELGIFHFGQIAAWTPAEARWMASHLAFPERIERDDWIGQATILASGGRTGYVKAAPRTSRGEAEEPATGGEDGGG